MEQAVQDPLVEAWLRRELQVGNRWFHICMLGACPQSNTALA
ncbi:hypothetical protein HaLaN_10892 [Haematococcus lacustris]|uniref:Uncharacterized protein n=1 Tax=Haematococcus lacustris TaxID=44745 RepID=A0A699Z677_HAELA|nr:hypothetical protein HaLaN_10892 [Haematococcus lacustris]